MVFGYQSRPNTLPSPEQALPDRAQPAMFNPVHLLNGNRLVAPLPSHVVSAVFGLGCFWGAERLFWQLDGVFSTAAGYAGGITAHPSYEDVCSGMTGHTEVVLVNYDPALISYEELLAAFWEAHDPTQGMRQGNDLGTQYRSAIYAFDEAQLQQAADSAERYQQALAAAGYAAITTDIEPLKTFYYADDYHQQYLAKNPNGYCGLAGTGTCYLPDSVAP